MALSRHRVAKQWRKPLELIIIALRQAVAGSEATTTRIASELLRQVAFQVQDIRWEILCSQSVRRVDSTQYRRSRTRVWRSERLSGNSGWHGGLFVACITSAVSMNYWAHRLLLGGPRCWPISRRTRMSVSTEGPSAGVLYEELRALGYLGSYGTVRDWVGPLCAVEIAPARNRLSKVRRITSWVCIARADDEQIELKQVLASYGHFEGH